MLRPLFLFFVAAAAAAQVPPMEEWPAPQKPVIPAAAGWVVIPDAAVPPDPALTYRAVFDATRAADEPTGLLPALNMAGGELNGLAASGVPPGNVHFAVVFHGKAVDGLLDDAHYRDKYGVDNPNLPLLEQLRDAGVELLVCGQKLAADRIDPRTLSPAVTVASDAYVVLMTYQGRGYALLPF